MYILSSRVWAFGFKFIWKAVPSLVYIPITWSDPRPSLVKRLVNSIWMNLIQRQNMFLLTKHSIMHDWFKKYETLLFVGTNLRLGVGQLGNPWCPPPQPYWTYKKYSSIVSKPNMHNLKLYLPWNIKVLQVIFLLTNWHYNFENIQRGGPLDLFSSEKLSSHLSKPLSHDQIRGPHWSRDLLNSISMNWIQRQNMFLWHVTY